MNAFKLLNQSVITALITSDTQTALTLLKDAQGQRALLDPLEGPSFHAEVLYYAIKKANLEVIRFLLKLCIDSDVSFYTFCGQTPISLVMEEGLNDLLPIIMEKTDKKFALMMAVKLKNNKLIDLLLKNCFYKERFLRFLGICHA